MFFSLFFKKYSNNILLIDKIVMFVWVQVELLELFFIALLGIDNSFKTLVANALKFSTKFYEENFPQSFVKSGTIRIPKK